MIRTFRRAQGSTRVFRLSQGLGRPRDQDSRPRARFSVKRFSLRERSGVRKKDCPAAPDNILKIFQENLIIGLFLSEKTAKLSQRMAAIRAYGSDPMNYQRYFKPEQSLLLRVDDEVKQDGRTELMSVSVVALEEDRLLLSLPYGADIVDAHPFTEDMPFIITTEVMGLGVRATGRFLGKTEGNRFTLQLHPDLQMFQRRISQRLNCQLGIRFSRAARTLQTMKEIWERNLEVLHSPEAPLIFEGFKQTRINISSGGIRLSIKPPADQGELCLILINLEDGRPPICAISEIVWACMEDETAVTAGMRFINILSEDQQRIEDFIDRQKSS